MNSQASLIAISRILPLTLILYTCVCMCALFCNEILITYKYTRMSFHSNVLIKAY